MKLDEILDELKLELTGYILDMEITDETLVSVINKALRELTRYWDETSMISCPFASCIDLDGEFFREKVSSIVKVYRTEGTGDNSGISVMNDPLQMAQFAIFSNGGTMYNLNDYVMNYASWLTMYKIKNTMSTELAFKEDRHNKKLYINNYNAPSMITIEYIPDELCLELKSLKYYLLEYRDMGIFMENIANKILDDVVKACKPKKATVTGVFTPRGGLRSVITARYEK